MDLIDLVRGLSLKVDSLVNGSSLTNPERFQLREEILAATKGIAHAVDGPEQALKTSLGGSELSLSAVALIAKKISTQPAPH